MKKAYSASRISHNKWLSDIDKQIQQERADLKRLKTGRAAKKEAEAEQPRQHENILKQARQRYDRLLANQSAPDVDLKLVKAETPKVPVSKPLVQPPVQNKSSSLVNTPRHLTSGNPVDERLFKMKDYYARKREAEKLIADRAEQATLRSPKLNARSKKLANRSFEGNPQQKVEDRLLTRGAQRQKDREKKIGQKEYEAKLNAYPLITPTASSLQQSGTVTERLYSYQDLYDENKQRLTEASTPVYSYQPIINKTNYWRNARQPRRKRPQSASDKYSNIEPSFKPQLSERSMRMANRMEEKAMERLTKATKDSFENKWEHTIDPHCTFTPTLNKTSIEIDFKNSKISGGPRWEELHELHQYKVENQKPKEPADDEECTFSPQLIARAPPLQKSVVDRCNEWNEQKEAKVRFIKSSTSMKDLDGWTFKPNLSKDKISVEKNQPLYKPGTKEFMLRQQRARENTRYKEMALNKHSGANWKPETTKSQQFQLKAGSTRGMKKSPSKGMFSKQGYSSSAFKELHMRLHNK